MSGVVEHLLDGTPTSVYPNSPPRSLMHDRVRCHPGDENAVAYVESPHLGTLDEHLTTIIDTEAHLDTRATAIALHRSHRSPFDGRPTVSGEHSSRTPDAIRD
ncbi:MAG: hypothetical protein ABJA16_09790, partial [Nakamurella sp.]